MKAAVFHGTGQPMTIEDVEIEAPGRDEVLVRTRAVGLCHSDLHFIEGKYPTPVPTVLGHEAAGVVEAVGEGVTHLQPGDHVVSCLSVFCGHCEYCVSGHLSVCNSTDVKLPPGKAKRLRWRGEQLNQFLNLSAFAEKMLVHRNALVKVRSDMPLDLAALLGCGVLTGWGSVTRSARIQAGSSVAVLGCGGVGLSAVHAARVAGAGRIIAVDIDPSKLELARLFGATDVVDGNAPDRVKQIKALTNGGVDYSFECVGLKSTAEDAFDILRSRGLATLVGMIPPGVKVEFTGADFFLRERRVQGSMMGSNNFTIDIPRMVDLHMQGRMQLEQLVSQRLRLEDINEGFEAMKKGGVARSVIVFD